MSHAAALPVPAATVVLLRDGPGGVQVWLQQRPDRLAFAGGLWVFPGGRLDPADGSPELAAHWSGPSSAEWAELLDVSPAWAQAYVAAACRETFEETGLLLIDRPVDEATLAAARDGLLCGATDLTGTLAGLGGRLATGLLRYWAWWITPPGERRRYDTRFFVAGVAPGTPAAAHAAEATSSRWVRAADAADDESLGMLPPTRHEVRTLARFRSVAEVLAAADHRQIEPILPHAEGAELVMPWGDRVANPFAGGD